MTISKNTALQAAAEIRELRRRCEVLQAKVDTMDLMAAFVFARPMIPPGITMGEDVAWKLEEEARQE